MTEKKTDILQFDKRVMHRFVTEGKLTPKDVEQHLANLPDRTEESEDIADLVYDKEQRLNLA